MSWREDDKLIREIRVFMASPGDLVPERRLFFETLPQMVELTNIRFVPIGYELIQAKTGIRPQDAINELVDSCDVFITVFHRQWGQQSPDSVGATSYTEEEFTRALSRFSKTGTPQIICLFKNVDIGSLADPGPQLSQVLRFRKRLEQSKKVLYRTFSAEDDLRRELELHLYGIAKGTTKPRIAPVKVLLPVPEDAGPDEEWKRDLALARQAVSAASEGRLEEATVLFAQLSQTTISIPVLEIAEQYFADTGHSQGVESIVDRRLALLRDRRIAAREYASVMMRAGWLEDMIQARLSVTPRAQHEVMDRLLRRLFNDQFLEEMVTLMANNFTLGELRTLTRFYSGEAATVSGKMAQFMGAAMPPVIERLMDSAIRDLGLDADTG
jgi:hypothetical protein